VAAIAGTHNLQHRQVGPRKDSLDKKWRIATQVTNERFRAAASVDLSTGCAATRLRRAARLLVCLCRLCCTHRQRRVGRSYRADSCCVRGFTAYSRRRASCVPSGAGESVEGVRHILSPRGVASRNPPCEGLSLRGSARWQAASQTPGRNADECRHSPANTLPGRWRKRSASYAASSNNRRARTGQG
jgi:hypothetical protein